MNNIMYTNLTTKTQALMGFNITSKARCFTELCTLKSQSLPFSCCFIKPHNNHVEMGIKGRPRSGAIGFQLKGRAFSSMHSRKDDKGSGNSVVRNGRVLPWLASSRGSKDFRRTERVGRKEDGRSSWGKKSEKKFEKKEDNGESYVSSWEVAAEKVVGKDASVNVVSKSRIEENYRSVEVDNGEGVEGEEEGRDIDAVDDPRWDRIKSRFRGGGDVRGGYEKPELRRWNNQESWGRKTWKEATESSVPKMVGEGIYGVGPVLAALSAERREFYALYIQEGLDLSNNNRKKKDKKGFEKVLKIADKIGLSIKKVSKHDLNMVVDSRPHQGLVLDASPLEMVKIMKLDPVSGEDDKGSLWVALDEVTDPQNLGAIIRSAYFFGAAGIILCAKNSAPLSGVVSKASAGSLELMELRYCKNMMQFLTSSAENGWRVLGGSVSSKAVPLNEVAPSEPTILVLGSEGTGLRPLVERSCTQLVRIPGNFPVDVIVDDMESVGQTSGNSGEEFRSFLAVESLNVSVAAGVLLHHLSGDTYTKTEE